MILEAVPTSAMAHAAVPSIPFRPEGSSLAGNAWSALGVLIVLLSTFVALAVLAQKMGWLQRWSSRPTAPGEPATSLRVEQTLRINARTVVYRLGDMHGRYLLVQSGNDARLTIISSQDQVVVDG